MSATTLSIGRVTALDENSSQLIQRARSTSSTPSGMVKSNGVVLTDAVNGDSGVTR